MCGNVEKAKYLRLLVREIRAAMRVRRRPTGLRRLGPRRNSGSAA